MADLYTAMIGGMTPQQDPQMLADRLRGREARSMLAQLSGDSVLGPYGRQEAAKILPTAKQLGTDRLSRDTLAEDSKQKGLQRAMMQQYYADQAEHNRLKREQDLLIHRERMAQEELNRENRLELAGMRALQRKARPLTDKQNDRLQQMSQATKTTGELLQGLGTDANPKIPGVGSDGKMPLYKTAEMALASYGIGTQEGKDAQRWWSEFRRQWDLVERNEMFGATLTPQEKASWKSATFGEEMTRDQIKDKLRIIHKSSIWKLYQHREALRASGFYDDQQIDAIGKIFNPYNYDPTKAISLDEEDDIPLGRAPEQTGPYPQAPAPKGAERDGMTLDMNTYKWKKGD